MLSTGKSPMWLFVMFLAGSAVGFLIGAYTGGNFGMGLIVNNVMQRDALEIGNQVDALRQLRGGSTDAGIELIEAGIDDALVVFDPHEPIPGIDDDTEARVDAAIRKVFEYRREFPRRSKRTHVDEMVDNLFRKRGLVTP